ncbi:MAG: hypothetical protein ACTS22_00075 [Phycisphaerales bacterium]
MTRDFSIREAVWVPLVLLCCTAGAWGEHPQDGPHADVRISISDDEVRFNMGFNLPFVDHAAPTVREVRDTVDPAEAELVERALLRYIRNEHAVVIDGIEVLPRFEPLLIDRIDDSMVALFPNMGRAALTRLSLVAVYPAKSDPQEIRLKWGAFPGDVLSVGLEGPAEELPPLVIQAQLKAEGRIQMIHFSESEPWVVWRPSGTEISDVLEPVPDAMPEQGPGVPVLSMAFVAAGALGGLVLAARGQRSIAGVALAALLFGAVVTRGTGVWHGSPPKLSREQALRVFEPLHTNVYRAFDYSSDDDVYDALARSVSGDLLDDLFTQIRSGLRQAENDGAIGRVTDVKLRETRIEEVGVGARQRGFDVRAAWEVEGTVYHFGHSHAKRREFEALFRVEPRDEGWRITRSDPIEVADLRPTEL